MIIDTHTHFYDPHRPEGVPWPEGDSPIYRTVLPEHFRALPGANAVTGTVVVEASEWLEDNQWLLDLADQDPFIVGFVGHVRPNQPQFPEQLERFASHPHFCGIRCHRQYLDDIEAGSFLNDIAVLADRNLSLDLLAGLDQLQSVAQLSSRLPELRIIVNHAGHVKIDGDAPDPTWLADITTLGSHANVYMKASGMMELCAECPAPHELEYYRPTLDAMWDAFGAERLIFGSNWPVCELAGEFATFLNVVTTFFEEKGESVAQRYFSQNATSAYNLPLG